MYYIVGLGNPGEEYKNTRHNTGRIVVEAFAKKTELSEKNFKIIVPDSFMNKSGLSLKPIITSKKKAQNLIVVYDDLDLPLGSFKLAFNRGSGGHKGVESVARSLKTKEFIRVKVGVSPTTPSGKLRKPKGEEKIIDFILGDFKPPELLILKKVSKKVAEAIEMTIEESLQKAMSIYN